MDDTPRFDPLALVGLLERRNFHPEHPAAKAALATGFVRLLDVQGPESSELHLTNRGAELLEYLDSLHRLRLEGDTWTRGGRELAPGSQVELLTAVGWLPARFETRFHEKSAALHLLAPGELVVVVDAENPVFLRGDCGDR